MNAAARDGRTALMLAANGGHTETITALLAYPGVDVSAADGDGRTARAHAKAKGHGRIASLLRADRRYAPTPTLTTKLRDTLTAFRRALRQRSRRRELGADVIIHESLEGI